MSKLTAKEAKKFHLTTEEVDAYNDWEYRNTEGGRTPYPSRITEEELQANLKAIKDFSENNKELERRFYKIKSAIDSENSLQFSNVILILAIISVVLFFKGIIPFIIPLFLVGGFLYMRY